MSLRVILVEPIYMANIGYVARAMMNFGFTELFIVNPKGEVELASSYAAHAADLLRRAIIVEELQDSVKDVDLVIGTTAKPGKSPRKVSRKCVSPEEFAVKCTEHKGRIALLFGREDTGLRNIEVERCDMLINIPANPSYSTLNIAHAATIIFYEIYVNKVNSPRQLLDRMLREKLLKEFHELVVGSKISSYKIKFTETAFKNIMTRSWITKREATLLIGVFSRSVNKLQQRHLTLDD